MHIVQCLTHSTIGGGQQVVHTLVRTLLRIDNDLRFTVVLPSGGPYVDRYHQLGAQIVEFPLDVISTSSLFRFPSVVRNLKPDVLHSHGKGAGLYARLANGRSLSVKSFHSFHGFHPPAGFAMGLLYQRLESVLAGRVEKLVAVSQSEADEIATSLSVSHDSIRMIPNVVDRAEVTRRAAEAPDNATEEFLRANHGSFIVAMIGRDDPIKNYDLAFEAFRLLFASTTGIAVVIVGVNPVDDRIQRLRPLAAGRMLALPIFDNAASVLQKCHILLLTSRKEGNPLVALESLCLGKPVVGTNVGGIRDVVIHRENGMLCEQNAASIVEAISELKENPTYYRSLSIGARNAGERMDVGSWAQEYLDLYRGKET